MSIEKKAFQNEQELDKWVQKNYKIFFGEVIYIPGTFFINTKRNKGAKPDGFILDLNNSTWSIVETELLNHGVWDHITEQLVRFIVATRNDVSQRKIRNLFFNEIEKRNLIKDLSLALKQTEARLIQKIETIVEGQTPDIVLFIDEVNEDLEDMIEALNATVKVFKIQKYLVNGQIEYLSPDGNKTVVETSLEEVKDIRGNQSLALELIGGGQYLNSIGGIKFYKLKSGELITMKYSKRYDNDQPFWYAFTPSAMEKFRINKIRFLAFLMADIGVLKLPFSILEEYILQANTTNNPDGTIKHYHLFIRDQPTISLYTNQVKKQWDVEEYFFEYA